MRKDHIENIGKEKGQKVIKNSSTWYHISIGNGTYITAKHAMVHIEIAQLKLDIGMTK